jgi:hypothetical protein
VSMVLANSLSTSESFFSVVVKRIGHSARALVLTWATLTVEGRQNVTPFRLRVRIVRMAAGNVYSTSHQRLRGRARQPSEAPARATRIGLEVRFEAGAGAANLFHLDGKRIAPDAQSSGDLSACALLGIEQSSSLRREVTELGNADAPPLPLALDLRPEVFGPCHGVILALDLSVGHLDSGHRRGDAPHSSGVARTPPICPTGRRVDLCRRSSWWESFVRQEDVSPSVSAQRRCAILRRRRIVSGVRLHAKFILRSLGCHLIRPVHRHSWRPKGPRAGFAGSIRWRDEEGRIQMSHERTNLEPSAMLTPWPRSEPRLTFA